MDKLNSTEEAKEKRKRIVDARFGEGTYEKSIKKIHPHRCARHLDDVIHALFNGKTSVANAVSVFATCFFSNVGNEPKRVYPDSEPFNMTPKN